MDEKDPPNGRTFSFCTNPNQNQWLSRIRSNTEGDHNLFANEDPEYSRKITKNDPLKFSNDDSQDFDHFISKGNPK